jgi:hypothetical protein
MGREYGMGIGESGIKWGDLVEIDSDSHSPSGRADVAAFDAARDQPDGARTRAEPPAPSRCRERGGQ